MQMILTDECEKCIHSIIDDENKAMIQIYCRIKNKTYYWGQCIPCEFKEIKEGLSSVAKNSKI